MKLVHSAQPAVPRDRLLRLPSVESQVGLKKSAIYAGMKSGTFPQSIKVNRRTAVWSEAAILKWIQDQINGTAVVEPVRQLDVAKPAQRGESRP